MVAARVLALAVSFVAVVLATVSCTSVSEKDLINAGVLLLKQELAGNYSDEFGRYFRDPPWQDGPGSTGRFDNERMPEWAEEDYAACVYWEDEFVYETYQSRPGPDSVIVRQGTGWGWILVSKKLESYFLETGLRWIETEDGVETQSDSRIFKDAWDDPST